MSFLSLEDYQSYVHKKIDYNTPIIQERKEEYIRLKIYLILTKPNYEEYKTYCSLFNIKPLEDKDAFLKWYNNYSKKFSQRIEGFSSKWNVETEFVKNKILEDEFFAYSFIEDPGRKTFHQHYAANWITTRFPFIFDFEEPPSGGDAAFYIDEGVIKTGKELTKEPSAKSIDFIWKYKFKNKSLRFYATHKYTAVNGGNQDNQFKDVCIFLEQAKLCIDEDVVLLSITDGDYYKKPYTKGKGTNNQTRLEYMNSELRGERSCSTTTDNLLKDIIPFIQEWLVSNFDEETISSEIEKLAIINSKL